MSTKTAVIINLDANEGRAGKKWQRIRKDVESVIHGSVLIQTYTVPFPLQQYLEQLIMSQNIRSFIIGGGDGSVHYFIQCLVQVVGRLDLSDFVVGMIGLGSSNDFTKPAMRHIKGIPVRIDASQRKLEDLGLIEMHHQDGTLSKRLFCLNSGVGVIAEANYQFNHPDRITSFLKKTSTGLSIIWTAVNTILKYRSQFLHIEYDQYSQHMKVSNLSVTLSPYISGSFHYKKSKAKKGFLDLFICRDMSKIKLLHTLLLLTKGRFYPDQYRVVEAVHRLSVSSPELIPLEADGEIYLGHIFEFTNLPDCIQMMN